MKFSDADFIVVSRISNLIEDDYKHDGCRGLLFMVKVNDLNFKVKKSKFEFGIEFEKSNVIITLNLVRIDYTIERDSFVKK